MWHDFILFVLCFFFVLLFNLSEAILATIMYLLLPGSDGGRPMVERETQDNGGVPSMPPGYGDQSWKGLLGLRMRG